MLAITLVTDPKSCTIQAAMTIFVGKHGSNYAIAAASLVLSAAYAPALPDYVR